MVLSLPVGVCGEAEGGAQPTDTGCFRQGGRPEATGRGCMRVPSLAGPQGRLFNQKLRAQ